MTAVVERYPRAFGRYSLLAPLAEGGMGALYLACQGERGLEKLCVIKTVLPQLADAEYVARFRDEAKVVVRLSHGNLVPVFDAGTVRVPERDRDELYLAMEHVDGKDLRAVWNRCAQKGVAFPVEVAAYLARELARGLHHAHTSGDIRLVHRDVSPPNILLSFGGELKLTDFGLAASAIKKEKTAPGVIYGKVSYMSPEQARGEPLDGRTDLYAIGVILWELLTGRQLFPQAEVNLIERVRAPKIDPPSSLTARVPPELDSIVMRALAPAREDRYADCEGLRSALAGFLAKAAPTIDNERVAAFLRHLFGDEIDRERKERVVLLDALHGDAGMDPVRAANAVALSATRPGVGAIAHSPGAGNALIGSHLDSKYLVRRLIGEGGMGLVYEAEHVEIGRRVAIKVLHPAYTRSPDVVARFRSEARAATRIGHPHIIDVFDSGTTVDGAVYLVMEYLDGRDLGDVIGDSAPMPVARAAAIAREICEALAAAHKAGILHRDLKPENIFLVDRAERRDFVKVLDFGIAKTIDSVTERSTHQTTPGVAMGTPEYMAPEQAAGLAIDARADIYSVGAIVYEMLCGHAPHEGDNVMEVLTKKATVIPTSLMAMRPEIPVALATLVDRTLARDPAERPASMRAFADELGALIDGREAAIDRRINDRRSQGHGANLRTGIVAGIGGAVLVGGLLLWAGGHRGQAPTPIITPVVAPVVARAHVEQEHVDPPRPVIAAAPPVVKQPIKAHVLPPPPKPTVEAKDTSRDIALREAHRKLAEAAAAQRLGQFFQANALYNQVRGMKIEGGAATTGLAEVAFQQSNYPEAARIGRRAIDAGGGVPAHMVLGNALFKLGRFDEASLQYQEVLKVEHGHAEAKSNLKAAQAAIAPQGRMKDADIAWMLVASAMVLVMTPALGFFYGGMVRAKNALNTLMMSVVALGVVGMAWALIGYSLAFSGDGPLLGGLNFAALANVGLEAKGSLPHVVFFSYQATFAIITGALVSGAIVERMRFRPYVAFLVLFTIVIYAPMAHWVWGGGWLARRGTLDFAGGTVVHINAAAAALVAAIMLGPRKDYAHQAILPHNVPFTLLGAGLLWFGWFGFNAGSALAANAQAGLAFANTLLSPVATLCVWIALDLWRSGRVTAVGAATAIVVGLVAITPAAGLVSPRSALIIGALAAAPSYFALLYRARTRLDDSLDVVAAHGLGGMVGALLTGVFAEKAYTGGPSGLLEGNPSQVGLQALGIVAAALFSGVGTFVLLKLIGLVSPLRADGREEGLGLDITQHGEEAYTRGDGALLILRADPTKLGGKS